MSIYQLQGTNAQSGNNLGSVGSGRGSPKICGVNTGSHMYIDAGARSDANGLLTAVFTGTSVARKWKIKIGQIPCDGVTNPRFGCLQYHTATSGTVSWNKQTTLKS